MDSKLKCPKNTEYCMNIENVQLKIWVVQAPDLERERSDENTDSEPYANHTAHRHAHTEIFCCPSGCLHIQTEDRILQLNRGDIAVIPAGIAHHMLPVHNPGCWAALRFQISPAKRMHCKDLFPVFHALCDAGGVKLFCGREDLSKQIQCVFRDLIVTDDPYSMVLSLFNVLYQLTMLQPSQTKKQIGKPIQRNDDSNMQRYEVLDYYINKRYMHPLTPKLLAEQLYISERQISRIVQNKYGMSFHKVLIEKRILVAEQMLEKSDIKIQEISQAIGFHSPDIFFREFKKKHGMTPKEYRSAKMQSDH